MAGAWSSTEGRQPTTFYTTLTLGQCGCDIEMRRGRVWGCILEKTWPVAESRRRPLSLTIARLVEAASVIGRQCVRDVGRRTASRGAARFRLEGRSSNTASQQRRGPCWSRCSQGGSQLGSLLQTETCLELRAGFVIGSVQLELYALCRPTAVPSAVTDLTRLARPDSDVTREFSFVCLFYKPQAMHRYQQGPREEHRSVTHPRACVLNRAASPTIIGPGSVLYCAS